MAHKLAILVFATLTLSSAAYSACVPVEGTSLVMDSSQCTRFGAAGCLSPLDRAYAAPNCEVLNEFVAQLNQPLAPQPVGAQAQAIAPQAPSAPVIAPQPVVVNAAPVGGGVAAGSTGILGGGMIIPVAGLGLAAVALGTAAAGSGGSSSSTR